MPLLGPLLPIISGSSLTLKSCSTPLVLPRYITNVALTIPLPFNPCQYFFAPISAYYTHRDVDLVKNGTSISGNINFSSFVKIAQKSCFALPYCFEPLSTIFCAQFLLFVGTLATAL